jgi:LytS/YehU family sensor histidine kinase
MGFFWIKQNISLLVNLLLILALALFLLQPLSWDRTLPDEFWIKQGVLFILWISLYKLNSDVLVPRLLFKNKTGPYLLILVLIVLVLVFGMRLFENAINLPELMHKAFNKKRKGTKHYFDMMVLLSTLLVVAVSTGISAVRKWQKDTLIRQELEQEKISSELLFLKAQINPHFFFNTLHSIYALTVANSGSAADALYTLSHMMRYVLYETQNGTTLLSKEISFVKDYIRLMQLRLTDRITLRQNFPEPLVDYPIAPMLLLPFIENAFKHGVSTLHPGSIEINIKQEKHRLIVKIRNTLLKEKGVIFEENGIGLANTRRRLDLLYPQKYTLNTVEDKADLIFTVDLEIDLA